VRLAGAGMESLADHLAGGVEHDRPDHRVGAGRVVGLRGELQRPPHPVPVGASLGSGSYARVRICWKQSWQ